MPTNRPKSFSYVAETDLFIVEIVDPYLISHNTTEPRVNTDLDTSNGLTALIDRATAIIEAEDVVYTQDQKDSAITVKNDEIAILDDQQDDLNSIII